MTPAELQAIRTGLSLTQAEMAAAVGVKLRQYSNYERAAAAIPDKVANGAFLALQNRAQNAAKLDGRFKKPIDYEALGKPVYIWTPSGEARDVNPDNFKGARGDPASRPRAVSLEEAVKLYAAHWPVTQTAERDSAWHIWIQNAEHKYP